MRRTTIGRLEVSVLGVGCNSFGTDFFGNRCTQADVDRIVGTALDAGINLFDTAEEYSVTSFLGEGHSEEMLGIALRNRRDEAVIASKWSNYDEAHPDQKGAARIIAACEASLQRLGVDHLDLYQQHQQEHAVPMEEILTALDTLVQQGKVREVGCCNLPAAMLDEAAAIADRTGVAPYRSLQVQYSVLERPADDVLVAAERHGLPLLAYFPLASGVLTGKYKPGEPPPADSRFGAGGQVAALLQTGIMSRRPLLSDERLATVAELALFAESRGHALLDLALSYLAGDPRVGSVLTGVTRPGQVTANAAAIGWEMTAADRRAADEIVAREA
ncbi:MAG TPA: aldo/keto reductase [Mycobacteriales bacterium]|nr:aldo/keto reductase [Mycobacteriales bacterium]